MAIKQLQTGNKTRMMARTALFATAFACMAPMVEAGSLTYEQFNQEAGVEEVRNEDKIKLGILWSFVAVSALGFYMIGGFGPSKTTENTTEADDNSNSL